MMISLYLTTGFVWLLHLNDAVLFLKNACNQNLIFTKICRCPVVAVVVRGRLIKKPPSSRCNVELTLQTGVFTNTSRAKKTYLIIIIMIKLR